MRRLFMVIGSLLLAFSLTVSGSLAQSTPEATTEDLQERIAELEAENEDLKQENERLKKRIEDMSAPSRTPRGGASEAEEASAPVLQVGDTWEGNDWSITVTYLEITPSLTTSYETNTARGVFAIVHMTVVNEGNAPASFPYDDIVLVDSDGRAYSAPFEPLFNLTYVLFDNGGQYGELQPGLPYDTGVIYDIPATSTGLTLTSNGNVFIFELD